MRTTSLLYSVCYLLLCTKCTLNAHYARMMHAQVGVRDYVKSLERAVIGTLEGVGVKGFTTANTGVWVDHPLRGESKICSIGLWGVGSNEKHFS